MPESKEHNEIDAYIAGQSADLHELLSSVRAAIKQALPSAAEKMSYGMPTYWYGRNLIHFAAQKNHLGLYPGADAVAHFSPHLGGYKTSKGAIQFPYKTFAAEQLSFIAEIAAWCGKD